MDSHCNAADVADVIFIIIGAICFTADKGLTVQTKNTCGQQFRSFFVCYGWNILNIFMRTSNIYKERCLTFIIFDKEQSFSLFIRALFGDGITVNGTAEIIQQSKTGDIDRTIIQISCFVGERVNTDRRKVIGNLRHLITVNTLIHFTLNK